jgi:hypothetical protein
MIGSGKTRGVAPGCAAGRDVVMAGSKVIEVVRVKITVAGRRVIEK